MRVAVITVGDELLAGDTVNTNAAWLGRRLEERGSTVERVIVVPDRVTDIAHEVNEARATYDAVVVTGGLGPTHDDRTMEGVAAAVGRAVEPHAEARRWIDEHTDYHAASLVDGTTHLPAGARMLPNPEGVAPGAVVGEDQDGVPIYVLPGVPEEMKAMFDTVADEFTGTVRTRRFFHADEPESALIDRFETVQDRFDVEVGSYPGGTVKVKVHGEDPDEVDRATQWLRARVTLVEEDTDDAASDDGHDRSGSGD